MPHRTYHALRLSDFFFFNDTATTEIYTLSLHDALPISGPGRRRGDPARPAVRPARDGVQLSPGGQGLLHEGDRKSTRLNSSHSQISYAVFCLKKKAIPPSTPAAYSI